MGRMPMTYRLIAASAASLFLAACTVHKQETPSLTGPSALGTSLVVTVSPDVLAQDGASQSLVQITTRDSNGSPLRNVSMRVEIAVDGVITDFGRLSARNVVSDSNGKASVVYTAPAPILGVTSDVVVQILVTPSETDFANATTRSVNIRVVPTGTVGPPTSPFRPDFVPPAATAGNPAVFTATITGTDPQAQVVGLVWDFGDGTTGGGLTATHTFDRTGTFLVTLAILDSLGRVNSVTHSVTVGQGTVPTADITVSPASPAVGQVVNFSGSGSKAEPGHRIVDYAWNFGDGNLGNGELVQHTYHSAGTYTVTLKVTDDVGRKSDLQKTTISVGGGGGGTGATLASFTISPSSPTGSSGSDVLVFFDGSGSTASSGAVIVSYVWSFPPSGSPAT